MLKNVYLVNIILKYFEYFIYLKLKNILDNFNINRIEFKKYYLFYLLEKLCILSSDINFIRNSKKKIFTKKMMIMIQKNIYLILKNEKI